MHGSAALPRDFRAFPYVDPDAPKGGQETYAVLGTFDSVNPFIVNGAPSPGTNTLVFETVMQRSADEPFSFYPSIAESIDTPPDRSWVEFKLDPRARFSDGHPLTAEDLAFTLDLLKTKGRPQARSTYSLVTRTEIKDAHTIRFTFKDARNRELPLIIASMPVLPKHATDAETFEKTTLKPMIGSGPYVFGEIRPGRSVSFRRNPDWWGKDLPANRGLFNFDEIKYEYFRDANSMFEAFKTGLYDVRPEGDATRWANDYNFAPVTDGRVIRQEIANGLPKPMNAFVFNARRPVFRDVRVREALAMLFDFEWANRNLFSGAYKRTCSFFEGSELSSCGKPAGEDERMLLSKFPDAVRADALAGEWRPPVSDGSGRDRQIARRAMAILKEAGWSVVDGEMRSHDGQALSFEIMVPDRNMERLALNYADSARRLGIDARVRLVDDAQYQKRKQTFDFDVLQFAWQSSLSPGNEQVSRWSSAAADLPGTFNFPGVKSAAADAMIDAILAARTREDLVAATRSLDRVLISGYYVIPLFHAPRMWIARWASTVRPDKPALALGAYGDSLASDPILAHIKKPAEAQ
jgi:peptide/nickel transport system substrate-binding protein